MNYCDTCIHKEVCGLEDNNDSSMTYCSDKIELSEWEVARMGFRMYVQTNDDSIEFPKFYGYADEKYVKQSWDFLKQDCEYDDMYICNCYGPVKLDSKSFAEFIDIYMDEYCHWADIGNNRTWIEYLHNKIKTIIESGKDVTLDWY